jgi:hypothetical protein
MMRYAHFRGEKIFFCQKWASLTTFPDKFLL